MVNSPRAITFSKASLHLLFGAALVLGGISAPGAAAATGEQTVERIRKEIAANPRNGPAILQQRLNELPVGERTKYAAAALAAAIEVPAGDGKSDYKSDDCDHIMRLYRAALAASPRSAMALYEVATRACPQNMAAFREAAMAAARAAGLPGIADGFLVLSPLGGTINPGNVGGPEGFEKEKKEKKEKKPKGPDVSPSQ